MSWEHPRASGLEGNITQSNAWFLLVLVQLSQTKTFLKCQEMSIVRSDL